MNKLCLSDESEKLLINYKNLKYKLNFNYKDSEKTSINAFYFQFQKFILNRLITVHNEVSKTYSQSELSNYRNIYIDSSKIYNQTVDDVLNDHLKNNRYIDNSIINYIKKFQLLNETKNEIKNETKNKPKTKPKPKPKNKTKKIDKKREKSYLIKYEIPYEKTFININFILYEKDSLSKQLVEKYDNKVYDILKIIHLIIILSNNNLINKKDFEICSRDGLNIFIFLTPFLREINIESNDILGATNANGGFCYGCINEGNIIVYRSQEYFKVLIHELIHNFGIDSYIFDFKKEIYKTNSNENKLYKNFINNFNLSREINDGTFDIGIQECIVEFWAKFLNYSLFSFNYILKNLTHTDNINNIPVNIKTTGQFNKIYNMYISIFTSVFELEILHNSLQCVKILKKNKLNYLNILSTKDKKVNNYKEETHIFSYFILQTILLYSYKNFINFKIMINYERNYNKFNIIFPKSLENISKLLKFIIVNSRNNDFINNIQLLEKIKYNKLLKTNLRMSLIEY